MEILFLTDIDPDTEAGVSIEVLPALDLLPHRIRTAVPDAAVLDDGQPADVVLLDARTDLGGARTLSAALRTNGVPVPVLAVMTESGLAALSVDWAIDDVVLASAGPAELDARLRLVVGRYDSRHGGDDTVIRVGDLTVDPETFSAEVNGHHLELALAEFELLKMLAGQPDRVFSRRELTEDTGNGAYREGARTIDVHISRLRHKLGPHHDEMIATVHRVGYKLVANRTSSPASRVTSIDGSHPARRRRTDLTSTARRRPPRR
jgi:DNA-binding response OmpR family regulator